MEPSTGTARIVWAWALLIASAPQLTSSATCNKHEFSCVSNTHYQLCLDGSNTTNTEALVCPGTTKCSGDCYEPCLPEDHFPSCKSKCNPYGFHCKTESIFQLCLDDSTIEPTEYECSSGMVCSENCAHECSATACSVTECEAEGRKEYPGDQQKFYLCTKNKDGSYTATAYSCPANSKFDGTKCVKVTVVPVIPDSIECKKEGRFPDADRNTGYHLCITGAVSSTYISCPSGTVFNAVTKKCTSGVSTTQSMSTTKASVAFRCAAAGKFPDPVDCGGYYMCTDVEGAGLSSTHYDCPGDSFYSPATSRCTNTRPDGCVTRARARARQEPNFRCSGSGRFEDPNSCRHYYWCDNRYESYHFSCPGESRYNPNINKCTNSPDFVCYT